MGILIAALTTITQWEWDFRWYGPVLLILILVFPGLWTILKPKIIKDQINLEKFVLKAILILLLVFVALIPAIVFPRYKRIAITGTYPVETQKFSWVDQHRDEPFTPSQDYRKVNVSIWYPQVSHNDEAFPLITFFHGGLGTINSTESLYLELASHGYVVYTIVHPYHTLWTEDENGSVTWVNMDYFRELQEEDPEKNMVQSYNYYQKWMKIRTDDINFVLDTILDNADTRFEEPEKSLRILREDVLAGANNLADVK